MTELTLKNERETLLAVAEKLEKGELVHRQDTGVIYREGGNFFNMRITCIHDCGTVMCIGGAAYLHENPEQYNDAKLFVGLMVSPDAEDVAENDIASPLYDLFYPETQEDWDNINEQQAATAIRKYVAGERGERIWDHVDAD